MRRGDTYQYVLISSGVLATVLFGAFAYREMFPEYLIYQKDYVALEKFRSQYTGDPPPAFSEGVKQIVIEREDKGPAVIDRCISCHVALQIEDFSPTKIARDINGSIIYDKEGIPTKTDNPNYIWKHLKEAIASEQDPVEKARLESLWTAKVGEFTYDVSKVLSMHPLMGRETRPFEFHPIEDYGCVSCHGGNGRGLVTDRAHGPVFDNQYEIEPEGFVPEFLEKDVLNDPKFSKVFNSKPGHRLLFQTHPLYVGALIQAKCIQCHQSTQEILDSAKDTAEGALKKKENALNLTEKSFQLEKARVISLLGLYASIKTNGYDKTLAEIKKNANDYTLPLPDREALKAQSTFLQNKTQNEVLKEIDQELLSALGSQKTVQEFENSKDFDKTFENYRDSKGTLFESYAYYNYSKELLKHLTDVSDQFKQGMPVDENVIGSINTDVDVLTKDYQKGKELFISQGCYACHRIAGYARGGVGPELSKEGESYPWFIKQSIVWPQADLKTSTMPNMKLDHEELEALVTYLLAQTGKSKTISDTSRKIAIQEWELGKKLPWEKPVTEKQIHSLHYGMTVFALEGCASCHQLSGYESNIGFKTDSPSNEQWFKDLFPENILGSQIIAAIEKNAQAIDQKIGTVRKDSILEEIEAAQPGIIESLYSNFKYALRAKNHEGEAISKPWQNRVRMVLKVYVQIYGLGRTICPKLDWSGVMRSDQWLMEHFIAPTSRVPKSIMPVFPFDETKFYALTQMLNTLAQKNVERERIRTKKEGFAPEPFYQDHCAQCHGDHMQGNGPVAEWIYPIPKNLKNSEFLRNLGKERAVQSIMHGVKGTPMGPWGELGEGKSFNNDTPVLTELEARQLVNWLFSGIPGGRVIRSESEVPKWNYTPEDVIKELKNEGNTLKADENELSYLPTGNQYIAALNPTFSNGALEIFDVQVNPEGGPDNKFYMIKQKYYTPENIEAGRHFFLLNCASCHGTEADGAGVRAEAMNEAKPRMLVNLDWIESHDDIRLLRSIKYGVPGTSMTPWGDFSSSLQRLQVVIYIRSLSEGKVQKREIENALYQHFDAKIDKDPSSFTLKREKDILYSLGNGFLGVNASNEILNTYLKLVKDQNDSSAIALLKKQIDQQIQDLQQKQGTKGVDAEILSWTKQKNLLASSLAELSRLKGTTKNDNAN